MLTPSSIMGDCTTDNRAANRVTLRRYHRPVRVCLATNGTHGDVNPFLAIGRELRARGHEVCVLVHPYFKADVDHAGLGFYPLAPEVDMDAIIKDPDLFRGPHGTKTVFRWIRTSMPSGIASFRAMLAERRPEILVSHCLMLGGRELCAREGIPFINASLAPCTWVAKDDPTPLLQQRPGRTHAAIARVLTPPARGLAGLVTDRLFAPGLRGAGLTELRDIFFGSMRAGDLNLGLWSPHFRAPCADDPPGARITGFACYDGRPGAGPDPGLERFLDAGEPPIVFAMGSAAHHTAGRFYELAVGACARLGVRAVLLTGDPARAPRGLPPTVTACGYAPFSTLFPRASVTVHHGGVGSVAQALRAGRPMLVVPRAHDQFNNAAHAHRLGVGGVLRFTALSERRLVRALDRLLSDPEIRRNAAELGRLVREEDGARAAADHVEAFCGRA
jgi:UDP:flavonoid glycosyltransferase YjiC (YdhE family)